ncbi:protein O-mannosyl-transferase family [Kordia sp.]|uniref:protein O-mannosyl-transferase family n=1 Tax=Kordia sp. TaxID=1965332 RepID=UPI003D6AD2FC
MQKTKKISSWILFVFVFLVYAISAPNTIAFWDSSEFITSNYTLQASHPPGAPFYTILCKVVLSFFPATKAALITNLISAFFGALTITLLFRITINIAERILSATKNKLEPILVLLSGITAALTLAFSDSFWTAATEAEVYTLSFALMTGMIHILLLWERTLDKRKEVKLLFFFAFLLGISTGVHLILIAIVIPLSILIAHKKFGLTIKSFIIAILLGCIAFFFIYGFVVQGSIKLANSLDVWLVNSFQMSLNSGVIIMLILISMLLSLALLFSRKRQKITLHHTVLGIVFFLIGMSSFFMSIQRSEVNTLVAESLKNSNKMLQYVRAEQFGISAIPLLKGPVFNAPLDKDVGFIDGKPAYSYNSNSEKYEMVHDGKFKEVNYSDEFTMFFPRMFDKGDAEKYKAWTPIFGEPINYPVQGEMVTINKPTFTENISFFINYQIVWLNARYLFWNFIGRQNDHHGLGYIKDGNWISGINAIDKSRVGDTSLMPEHYKNHKGNDAYYFLPFILGILGIIALRKHKHYFWTTLLLFLTFGIGITIYVNPVPSSILIRERDYIFIGSFVIFALWVGLSVIFLAQALQAVKNQKARIGIVATLVLLAAPIQLLAKGWDNHQRGHDNFAYNFGKAYLDACPPQSILITNGDNMTFPLWYLQQVEGYRTDIRVINYDQLNIETHINNLKKVYYDSKPLKLNLNHDFYVSGVEKLIPLQEETKDAAVLPILFEFLKKDDTRINWNGRMRHYIPSTTFSIPIDTTRIKKLFDPQKLNASYTSAITWNHAKKFYGLNEIVLMNILMNNINERPICFVSNGKKRHQISLEPYLIQHGLVNVLAPIQRKNPQLNPKIVATDMMYPYIINKVQFEGLDGDSGFIRDENTTYAREILRQNYYFLAQALLEEGQTKKAIEVLDKCTTLFPNKTIPYEQYAYAIGRLYVRAGNAQQGTEICKTAMKNIWDELQWMVSFNPPYPIINLRHAYRLKNMYYQMMQQFPSGIQNAPISEQMFREFDTAFSTWQKRNWPY